MNIEEIMIGDQILEYGKLAAKLLLILDTHGNDELRIKLAELIEEAGVVKEGAIMTNEEKKKHLLTAQLHFLMNCLSELSKKSLQSKNLSQSDNNENKAKLPLDFPPIEHFEQEPPISFEKACEEIQKIVKFLYEKDWLDFGDDVVVRAVDQFLMVSLFNWHDPMTALLEYQPDETKKMLLRLCQVSPSAMRSRIIQEALEWLRNKGDKRFFEKFGKAIGPKMILLNQKKSWKRLKQT